jgi:Ca2+-binding EF-hand superfamily protein
MIVKWEFLDTLHIDPKYGLLNARSAFLIYHAFQMLDFLEQGYLDDIQFTVFLTTVTSLSDTQSYKIFDLFDMDGSGSVEYEEFFLLITILVAIKNGMSKTFMYQNWRTCFAILDQDGSKEVSKKEFETLGFLFNFTPTAIRRIYQEFDVSGRAELGYEDFELFVLAAIELQASLDKQQLEQQSGTNKGSGDGGRGTSRLFKFWNDLTEKFLNIVYLEDSSTSKS